MLDITLMNKMFSLPQEGHPEKEWVVSQVLELEQEEGVIYDLGCGANKTLNCAIGVDVIPGTNLTASLDYLPSVASKSVDVIISRHSLEHIIDIPKAIKEWIRILKNEGKIIIVLPDHSKIDTMHEALSGGKHVHAFTPESFKSFMRLIPCFNLEKIETVVDGWSFGAVLSFDNTSQWLLDVLDGKRSSFLIPETQSSEVILTEDGKYNPKLNQINGMMSEEELVFLYESARKMDNVVEIGSWMGRSSHALLSGCPGLVYCVDTFSGSADPIETGHRDVYSYFWQNVGSFKNLIPVKKPSLEAVKTFLDKGCDFVFIDGGHQYHEVVADIEAWLPKAKKMIAVHDYHDVWVKKAVDELLGKGKVVGTIWYKELK